MKIGILTFHRAHNYGAVLQCFALQEVLKRMGHDVQIIDYRQKWTEEVYKPFSILVIKRSNHSIKRFIGYILKWPKRKAISKHVSANYANFRDKYLKISDIYTEGNILDFDACIIGSDQLWGMSCLGGSLDNVYLGNFVLKNGGRKVGYAISGNKSSIEYMQKHNLLMPSIRNFDYISFRESGLIDAIEHYTNNTYSRCIDPTLLSSKEIWEKMLNRDYEKKNYIVCYKARETGDSGFCLESKAKDLADRMHCELIDLSSNSLAVEDFVSAIAFSNYVVTTSFHATVFALIFNRPLASYLLHDGYDSRYENLLLGINAGHLLYEIDQNPCTSINIDWANIEIQLSDFRKDSLLFLKKSIENG